MTLSRFIQSRHFVRGILVVLVLFAVVGYGIALTRKGRVAGASLGSRRKEFFVPADIEIIFEAPVAERYERAMALLGLQQPWMLSPDAGHA